MLTTNSKGIVPRTEAIPLTIDMQFVAGFEWLRQPQARFVEKFSDTVSAGISLRQPPTVFPPPPLPPPPGGHVHNSRGRGPGFLHSTPNHSNHPLPHHI